MTDEPYSNKDLASDYEYVAKELKWPRKQYEQVKQVILSHPLSIPELYKEEGSLDSLDLRACTGKDIAALEAIISEGKEAALELVEDTEQGLERKVERIKRKERLIDY